MKPRDTAALMLLALVWGAAFLFIREVVREVPPVTVVAGRLVIAACVLVPVALFRSVAMPPRASWWALVFVALITITAAEEHITSSVAATLVGTMPLFTLIFTFVLGTERATADRVAGLVVGFVGAVVLVGPGLHDFTDANTLGEIAVVVSAASYAISTVAARQFARGEPLALAAGQMVIGAAIALPLALIIDGLPSFDVSGRAGLSWLALGTLSSGLAYVVFFTLVQRVSATQVSTVTYLAPIVATLLGWLILDETIGLNLIAGLALILAGIMGVNGTARSLFVRARPVGESHTPG
jgi:drug/metabolite transporter (DMT)-like permease